MKIIESKFIRLKKDHIAEYRRLVTPFFYINLKPREYRHYDYKAPYLDLGFFGVFRAPIRTPSGEMVRYHGWKDKKDNRVIDKEIEKQLNLTNEKIEDNILRLKA